MRALVSLYHQSESFITLENLDEAIDEAFIRNATPQNIREQSFYELKAILASKKLLPKIGSGRDITNLAGYDTVNTSWSDPKVKRDIEVQGALYGIEGLGKPGYEVLEEEHERIQGHLRNDKKS
ncbi:hypothetical protein NLI96_g9949 [Meripilus lineatus]|uniref:Uncharacterized protein n=1 Tax=Meripilus lineatus TaxID=2056292 RepID=A0AAD5UW15_9APHY|nr:hypothetical protein NLI96_g9949 [Physisporinus lineatus]